MFFNINKILYFILKIYNLIFIKKMDRIERMDTLTVNLPIKQRKMSVAAASSISKSK